MPTSSKKTKPSRKNRLHTSFQLTRRRDAVRPLVLPGFLALTLEVTQLMWRYKKIFGLLVLTYTIVYGVIVGLYSQSDYAEISDVLQESGGDLFDGFLGTISQAGILLVTVSSSSFSGETNEAQQLFSLLIFLLTWLTTVWLLRNLLAGHKVKLRDGLYNAAAPLIPTALIGLLIAVQLVPVSLAVIGYNAAASTGLLESGIASMLFWVVAGLLSVLSLYWITASLLALVIVTLPGMYPYKAIKTATEIVEGRRVKLLLRWVWMLAVGCFAIVVGMIPVILLAMGLTALWPAVAGVPIVPVALVVIVASVIVWSAGYVYVLYRKVVDSAVQ